MKVKLLKKVRKRYSIVRIDKIDYNNYDQIITKERWGTPFYSFSDKVDIWHAKSFETAMVKIKELIRERYSKQVKTPRTVKVWWTK